MIKYISKVCLTLLVGGLLLSACSKKPDVEYTSTYKMSGEWFVEYYVGGSAVTDFAKILTYNTTDPSTSQIWVDDPNTWTFKAKVNVDYSNLTFQAMDSTKNVRDTHGEKIKVYEGKVLPKAGHSKSGNIVDSIYLKVEFSSDPGTVYEIKGHQRTGFFEDEY